MVHWWDALELWIAGLPFIPQVLMVMAVMVPLCFGIARAVDKLLHYAADLLSGGRRCVDRRTGDNRWNGAP